MNKIRFRKVEQKDIYEFRGGGRDLFKSVVRAHRCMPKRAKRERRILWRCETT